jgi:hypothetical protein
MRIHRVTAYAFLALTVVMLGCSGGNHSADTEAPVTLSADVTQGPAEVNVVCNAGDGVTIPSMSIKSQGKVPGGTLSVQQDVKLTEWVVTATRTDGGTVASPQWRNYYGVYVAANGSATLSNYRIFPAEYFRQPPLNQLLPENAGFDSETGQRNIRQRLHIEIFGKTVAGAGVSVAFDVNLNFYSDPAECS